MSFWESVTLALPQTRKRMKDRGENERQRAGSALIAPGPGREPALHPEGHGRNEDVKRGKESEIHLLRCLMPVARLCPCSPLSFFRSLQLSSCPFFPSVPVFALFQLVCARHHETTAALEPFTDPGESKGIRAASESRL